MPKLHEVMGGQNHRFIVEDASLQGYGPSDWVLLSLEIKQSHWSILKKSCILYQFRADVQIYGHGSRYTADNDAAETDVYTQKCQVAVWWLLLPQR